MNPNFFADLTPKEAIKTIKSIWASEMAEMTYRTRLECLYTRNITSRQ